MTKTIVGMLGLLVVGLVACSGKEEESESATPEEACTQIDEVCENFPLTVEDCIEDAENGAPQAELNCVAKAESCEDAADCMGIPVDALSPDTPIGAGGAGD